MDESRDFLCMVRVVRLIHIITERTEVLLLLDNASCHGNVEQLTNLQNAVTEFLPNRTTFKLQPLDAGIISCIRQQYSRRQIERAADLIDEGVYDKLYDVHLKLAITWIYDIWYRLPNEMIL